MTSSKSWVSAMKATKRWTNKQELSGIAQMASNSHKILHRKKTKPYQSTKFSKAHKNKNCFTTMYFTILSMLGQIRKQACWQTTTLQIIFRIVIKAIMELANQAYTNRQLRLKAVDPLLIQHYKQIASLIHIWTILKMTSSNNNNKM